MADKKEKMLTICKAIDDLKTIDYVTYLITQNLKDSKTIYKYINQRECRCHRTLF